MRLGCQLACGLVGSICGLAGAGSSQAALVTAAEGAIYVGCAEGGSAVPLGRLDLQHGISTEGFVGSGLLLVFDASDEGRAQPGRLRAVAEPPQAQVPLDHVAGDDGSSQRAHHLGFTAAPPLPGDAVPEPECVRHVAGDL
jgi:hypothetical protein